MRARQIMTQQVIAVGPDTSIVDAADVMLRRYIGGLPVVDATGRLIGIISEGDFIRRAEIGTQRERSRWLAFLVGSGRIAANFAHAQDRKVGEIMTPDPLTVTEDTPLDQVAQIMKTSGVKRLPVMRGIQLVGIVTRSDFLAAVADLARNIPNRFAEDERIRGAVSAEIEQAAWRPCKLKVSVRDGVVSLSGMVASENARQAAIVAAENVPGVKKVLDNFGEAGAYPPPEEDLGGGDFVSLQEQPSTTDDEPL